MKKAEHWIMLYSNTYINPGNKANIDVTMLSHYLHLSERSCEKGIYLYIAKLNDDVPDYSTLAPFEHCGLETNINELRILREDLWLEINDLQIERKYKNYYTLKLQIGTEKGYDSGIKCISLSSTMDLISCVDFLKIFVGATHHWNIVCSEKRLKLEHKDSMTDNCLKRCVTILEGTDSREIHLYLVKGNDSMLDCSSLKPLIYEDFVVEYCISKDLPIKKIDGTGISVIRLVENRYSIAVDNSKQKNYLVGTGEYTVRPVLSSEIEESSVIHDLKFDTFEHWSVKCSNNPINLQLKDKISFNLNTTYFTDYVAFRENRKGIIQAKLYMYIVKMKENHPDYNTIIPVTVESFDIKHTDTNLADVDNNSDFGVEISRLKDNYYAITFDEKMHEEHYRGGAQFVVTPHIPIADKPIMLHGVTVYTW